MQTITMTVGTSLRTGPDRGFPDSQKASDFATKTNF